MKYIQSSSEKSVTCPARIRIGTRSSRLAIAQAVEVKNRLLGAFPEIKQDQIELVKFVTTGDKIQDRNLQEIGGKGLFTQELEEALFSGDIDFAVHSMKDMPDTLPDGLVIPCILEREDHRDAFISEKYSSIMDLPQGAKVGTSSVRRQSQLLMLRPDLEVVGFRGNVNTRLKKLHEGQVDATFLAVAGLRRLEMKRHITEIISEDQMLPAIAQGAIGVECVESNLHILQVLSKINHHLSFIRVLAERSFLKAMGGSCATPLGGLATFNEAGELNLRGLLAKPDGSVFYTVEKTGKPADATLLGEQAGQEMLIKAQSIWPM